MPTAPMEVVPVVLEGALVRLEPLTLDHLPGLELVGLHEAVWRWTVVDIDSPESMRRYVEEALAAARDGSQLPFATIERSSGQVVGSTRFMSIDRDHRRLEIGWTWLTPACQGRGYNDEAKLLALSHAFEVLGCRRVEFKTDSRNERSRAALLAIGATFEGIFRQHMISQGGRNRDSAWYSIIDTEWPSVSARLRDRLARRLARP